MEHRSHRGRLVLAPFWVSALCAAALAAPQEPQSKTRERPPQEPPKPAETRPAPAPAAPAPASPSPASRPIEERRAIAKDAARFEAKYRDAIARINRLTE